RLAGIKEERRTLCVYEVWEAFDCCATVLSGYLELRACTGHGTVANQCVLGTAIGVVNWAKVVLIDPVGQRVELSTQISTQEDAQNSAIHTGVLAALQWWPVRHPAAENQRDALDDRVERGVTRIHHPNMG